MKTITFFIIPLILFVAYITPIKAQYCTPFEIEGNRFSGRNQICKC